MAIPERFLALAAALFLMAGAAFGQQDRSEAQENDRGPEVAASSEPSPPSEPPVSSEPSPPPEPPTSSEPSPPPETPPREPPDPSEPRTAVPIGPGDHEVRQQRQPPQDSGDGYGGEIDTVYTETTTSEGGSDEGGGGQLPRWRLFGRGPREDMGVLDLDVRPGRAEIYLDGQRIGTADDFDGWPRHLRLPRGSYEIVFYLDGYKTLVRRVTVYPGLVIGVNDRMEPGASIRPEDLLRRD